MSEIETLARTIASLARPDMKPKQLIEAVREEHPKASKKDIVRAAFYAVIASAEEDPQKADHLHDFAMGQRHEVGDADPVDPEPTRPKNRKKRPNRGS